MSGRNFHLLSYPLTSIILLLCTPPSAETQQITDFLGKIAHAERNLAARHASGIFKGYIDLFTIL